jgi:hypothetical protein
MSERRWDSVAGWVGAGAGCGVVWGDHQLRPYWERGVAAGQPGGGCGHAAVRGAGLRRFGGRLLVKEAEPWYHRRYVILWAQNPDHPLGSLVDHQGGWIAEDAAGRG